MANKIMIYVKNGVLMTDLVTVFNCFGALTINYGCWKLFKKCIEWQTGKNWNWWQKKFGMHESFLLPKIPCLRVNGNDLIGEPSDTNIRGIVYEGLTKRVCVKFWEGQNSLIQDYLITAHNVSQDIVEFIPWGKICIIQE